MKRQKLEIGHPLNCVVRWYDKVPEPPRQVVYNGEILAWRDAQVIVRVKEYAVLRFWRATGIEVGNADHVRRGFKINLDELSESIKPAPGIEVPITMIDTDA